MDSIHSDLEILNIRAQSPSEEILQKKQKSDYLVYIFSKKPEW